MHLPRTFTSFWYKWGNGKPVSWKNPKSSHPSLRQQRRQRSNNLSGPCHTVTANFRYIWPSRGLRDAVSLKDGAEILMPFFACCNAVSNLRKLVMHHKVFPFQKVSVILFCSNFWIVEPHAFRLRSYVPVLLALIGQVGIQDSWKGRSADRQSWQYPIAYIELERNPSWNEHAAMFSR